MNSQEAFIKMSRSLGKFANKPKIKNITTKSADEIKKEIEVKKERVLHSIFMDKLPDRVPVVPNGTNFFPAFLSGDSITCEDFMFDAKKHTQAVINFYKEYDFDTSFMHYMLNMGKMAEAMELDLIKMPGRDLDPDVSYQWNERDRFKDEYYQYDNEKLKEIYKNEIAPEIAGLFGKKGLKKFTALLRTGFHSFKFLRLSYRQRALMEAMGNYNFFATAAIPPYDVVSFVFRTIGGLSRDLMKKQRREKLLEILESLRPLLMNSWLNVCKLYPESPGIFFPSERAFSLSPKQFEKYYWPTLKPMIIEFVEKGYIPILTMEGNTQHLVKFLLELPKSISRKCVYNCDLADILEVDKILDGHMAIWGGIPLSTICVGTPHDVEKQLDKVFPILKEGGGYAVSPALGIPDDAKPENIHAMINYVKKHGNY